MRRRLLVPLLLPLLSAAEPAAPTPWAFRAPVRADPPRVSDPTWVKNPIDAFVLARLDKAGLKPSPPASKGVLLRRVTYDLTGLPPTPKEFDDFLADDRPDAYDRVVNRLLASPHFGERQAQHWLDVVRYAETNGYEADGERPNAWRFRDWVVRAFNDDMPYDRFVTEQLGRRPDESGGGPVALAGSGRPPDRGRIQPLRPRPPDQRQRRCGDAASGAAHRDDQRSRRRLPRTHRRLRRCHDHKFDPIPQADYYRLQAFFAAAQPKEIDLADAGRAHAYQRQNEELNAKVAPLRKEAADVEAPVRDRLSEAKRAKLEAPYLDALAVPADKRTPEQKKLADQAETLIKVTWDEIVAALPRAERERRADLRRRANALERNGRRRRRRGPSPRTARSASPSSSSAAASPRRAPRRPGFLSVLSAGTEAPPGTTFSRIDLAKWLTRPDHPLTARVIVNRLWEQHFGRGVVATPDDFGAHGEPPTHPELLDWLAVELVDGWSLKHVHRLMVLSNAYRQDSRPADADGRRIDPDNHLLWRMNRRRLDAEALRDGVLAAAATLNPAVGGPAVRTPLEPEVYDRLFSEGEPDGLWLVTPDPHSTRGAALPLLETQPSSTAFGGFRPAGHAVAVPGAGGQHVRPAGARPVNGTFLHEQAEAFAARLLARRGRTRPPAWTWPIGRPCAGRRATTSVGRPSTSWRRRRNCCATGCAACRSACRRTRRTAPTRPRPRRGRLLPGHAQPQ